MFLPALPAIPVLTLLVAIAIGLGFIANKYTRLSAIILVCFVWSTGNAVVILNQTTFLSGRNVQVIATMQSVDLQRQLSHQVKFKIESVGGKRVFPPISVTSVWDPEVKSYCAGQRWKLLMHLRPVHSQLNSGGFDGQRWAVANRQTLTGRIVDSTLIGAECTLRQRIITRVQQQISGLENSGVLLALAFGERVLVSEIVNQAMKKTGTAHLMAISGLHVGVAALIGWALARGLQYALPLAMIDYRLPLFASWFAMIFYTWLSGVNPPAMRAALALSLWIILRLFRFRCHAWQVWLWCVALLMLSDPINILSDSFWLSCFAVASLIFWFQWAPLAKIFNRRWYWVLVRWGHLQIGMTILLLPMQIGLFHGVGITTFFANMWAVPVISFLSVPFVLAALVIGMLPWHIFEYLCQLCWIVADATLDPVFYILILMQDHWRSFAASSLAMSIVGWAGVIAWRMGWLFTHFTALITALIVLLAWISRVAPERWRVDMIDVGHGLSVLIEKNGKGVLYDTANRWEGGSQAERHILPYLQWRNVELEQIIISHSHMDHHGGTEMISKAFPAATVRSSFRGNLPCKRGEEWQWHGLNFKVLWPLKLQDYAGNDDSCVIRIDDGKFSVLLTGDIERGAERQVVADYRQNLNSTLLQVPHHGSKTSSSGPLLRNVKAEVAVASTARFNIWRLPSPKIKESYRLNHIQWRDTAHSGLLSAFFFDDYWRIKGLREQLMPRWYHQWFGVEDDNE